MKIVYARLFNLGNYENERVEVEDEVLPGESPHSAYVRIRALVYACAGQRDPLAAPEDLTTTGEDVPF